MKLTRNGHVSYVSWSLSSKLHLIVDGRGIPLAVDLTAGQRHESTRCEPLVQQVLDDWPDVLPRQVCGDKAYSAPRIRMFLKERWIEPVIAHRDEERREGEAEDFDRETYRRRSIVECCIGWLKECRAVATRDDKLATNFLSTVYLASSSDTCDGWIRQIEPTPRGRGRGSGCGHSSIDP